jgi:adenine-specific DNA-methyltransferase
MNEIATKHNIERALANFSSGSLLKNGIALLNALGYHSERQLVISPNTFEGLVEAYQPLAEIDKTKTLVDDWCSVDILFQLTGDDIRDMAQGHFIFDNVHRVDNQIIESYLFLAIELKQAEYSRSMLANLTREINRLFAMPVMILFKYGSQLTLSIINRRLNKRVENKDVLEKVTLIKGICFTKPLRAHKEILFDLSLYQLLKQYSCQNFVDLHRAWQKTLDVSELNKRFYREIAYWYFWAIKVVKFPNGTNLKEEEHTATSVIRLITRLIFVWFLKEKGLISDDLFNHKKLSQILNFGDSSSSSYYKAILQNLFFATLNQEMNTTENPHQRRFRDENTGHVNDSYLVTNLYRHEALFKQPKKALNLFATIPFLNGGLFECLDKRINKDGKDVEIRLDGFSDNPKKQPYVPNELFFLVDEIEIDLNEIFDTRGKSYKVRGLLEIFQSYKFTVDENTPIEEEIALDPELLGKVFENLLASYNPETGVTARKQTGSFYTPREIVNYMVDEALFGYLKTALAPDIQDSTNDKRLLNLLSYTETTEDFNEAEKEKLIYAIDHLKALDPACGSGAFPMGMLQKLVFILNKLDPHNQRWEERQVAKLENLIEIAERDIEDSALRNQTISGLQKQIEEVKDAFERNELNYGRKLFLLENCIYGVDIQPIAVQITKLRCFISLVVDQQIDENSYNRGIRPLPNLETKFVAANTLIQVDRPAQLAFETPEVKKKQDELNDLRQRRHFLAPTWEKKKQIREQDKKLSLGLADLLKEDGWKNDTAEKLAYWDPYDQSASAGYFDPKWMFGIGEGFDVVIGNPPYMRVQIIQKTQPEFIPYYRSNYQSAVGSYDLYAVFIERGYSLLSDSGQLAYIVPHKFFQATFGEGLRKLLTNRKALRQIVRFGAEQVFEEATTYTCLLFLSAEKTEQFDLIEVKSLERGEEVLQAVRQREEHSDYAHEKLSEPVITGSGYGEKIDWDFSIGASNLVLKRIQQYPNTLEKITRKIFVGLQTSADKIYVLEILSEKENSFLCFSKQLREEVEIEKGLVKPFLMGKDVHRYENVTAKNVVIFPYNIINGKADLMTQRFIMENYPLGWHYLERNENPLAEREHGKMRGKRFYAYIYPKNLTEFETVKIITPEIALGCQMTLDDRGNFYHTTKVYSFVFKESVKQPLKYLLGLLNSKVLWFFLSSTGYVLRGGYYTFKTEYLKPFPIAESRPEQEQAVATLVDYVLYLKSLPESSNREESARRRLMTAYFEQLIDALIYEIYFPEEFLDAEKFISHLLTPNHILPIEKFDGEKLPFLQLCFEEIYQQTHPVRQMVFFLDTIDAVRVIEERSRVK